MICFYHSADLDGHCSGAIVKYIFPRCRLIPYNYGDELPPEEDLIKHTLILVDCSFPIMKMIELSKKTDIYWIDHHKTIIEDAENHDFTPQGIQKIGTGGCELTWEYFAKSRPIPKAVRYLSRYDVWDHSDPSTLSFQYGMRLHDTDPSDLENMYFWKEVFFNKRTVTNIIKAGELLLKYEIVQNKKKCASMAFESILNVPGNTYKVICCNLGMVNSKLFDSVWDEEKYDMMVAFCRRNGEWNVSLYTTKFDIDCGGVAKQFGGGGHAQAAGFSCNFLPLVSW